MTAPANEQHGIELLIKADTSLIGSSTNSTLTITPSLVTTTSKDTDRWQENLYGIRSWQVTSESLYVESSAPITGQTSQIKIEVSSDGGTSYNTLQGLQQITLDLSMETADKTSAGTSGWTEALPSTRSVTVGAEAWYHDPAGTGATAETDLKKASENRSTVELRISFGASQQFDGTFRVESDEISAGAEETAADSYSFILDGALVNNSSSAGVGIGKLFTAYFADPPQKVTTLMQSVDSNQSAVSGATQYQGDGWLTSFTATVPNDAEITASATIDGTGSITRSTQ